MRTSKKTYPVGVGGQVNIDLAQGPVWCCSSSVLLDLGAISEEIAFTRIQEMERGFDSRGASTHRIPQPVGTSARRDAHIAWVTSPRLGYRSRWNVGTGEVGQKQVTRTEWKRIQIDR